MSIRRSKSARLLTATCLGLGFTLAVAAGAVGLGLYGSAWGERRDIQISRTDGGDFPVVVNSLRYGVLGFLLGGTLAGTLFIFGTRRITRYLRSRAAEPRRRKPSESDRAAQ